MISKKIQDAMNEQIKHETGSAYLYLAMAAYFNSKGWEGMAQWMEVQATEELKHAMKFFGHLKDRDGRVKLFALAQPQDEWASPLEAFQAAYKHEQFITGKINDLMKLAVEENDYPAQAMLQWFVTEQVEEEASASKVVHLLGQIGNSGNGMVMLDHQLGGRK